GTSLLVQTCPDPGLFQAPTAHRQVNGILGGSVLLSVDLSPGKKVKEIEWSFRAGSGVTIQLAEFTGGKFERPDPSDRFKQRLEKYNETSLRIKVLELDDRGVYEARIKIVPATVEEQAFLLAVYEPVPVPEIKSHSLFSTAAGCNVTLQCEVSGREEVNVSWRRGNPPRDLGNLERYQLTPDGRTLHLSLQPNPLDSTFTCMASNPMDQKNISLYLQSICQSGDILIAQAPTPHSRVNGTLGRSVVLSVDLSPGKKVKEIEWSFRAGSGVTIQVAEFIGEKFERPDPSDRFKQRLEKYNETSLRIKALELGD
uniref:Ig-like domain-containing protein n=1 Tax=Gopherus evgoodei TaxID=1825980 RepID=A0A8C4VVI4_9SAUR